MTTALGAEAAHDFSLHATTGGQIRLSDYRGEANVVVLFFPLAFTSTCRRELCSVRDGYRLYRDLDAEVLDISADSVANLQAWAEGEAFPFPLLSDFNRQVAPLYDSFYERLGWMQNVPKRSAFVVDKAGVVRYAEILENASELSDLAAIRETLFKLEIKTVCRPGVCEIDRPTSSSHVPATGLQRVGDLALDA